MNKKKIPGRAYADCLHAMLWLNLGHGAYLGIGRIELMEAIDRTGSIRQAAQSMSMSYKRAWDLVKAINQGGDFIVSVKGGVHGGGAQLTEAGHEQVRRYRAMEADFRAFAKKLC